MPTQPRRKRATSVESERQKKRLFWLQISQTVLLVDDDPEFLSALSPLLNTAGYSVITAKGAKEARSVLDDHRIFINAAIIDLELPEIGGFQIIGELASAQKRPIPIMAVTGVYNDVHLEVAEYLGAKSPFASQSQADRSP
jgi:DNA-binding response OmpR family regulator